VWVRLTYVNISQISTTLKSEDEIFQTWYVNIDPLDTRGGVAFTVDRKSNSREWTATTISFNTTDTRSAGRARGLAFSKLNQTNGFFFPHSNETNNRARRVSRVLRRVLFSRRYERGKPYELLGDWTFNDYCFGIRFSETLSFQQVRDERVSVETSSSSAEDRRRTWNRSRFSAETSTRGKVSIRVLKQRTVGPGGCEGAHGCVRVLAGSLFSFVIVVVVVVSFPETSTTAGFNHTAKNAGAHARAHWAA